MNQEELLDAWPGVRIDHDNAAFYQGLLEHRLLINRCNDCGRWHHPPRSLCPGCWSTSLTPTDVGGSGFVAYITILHQGRMQPGIDYDLGYPMVAIELDEQAGLRVTGTVVGSPPQQIAVGDRVRMVWRDFEDRPPQADFEIVR